MSADLSELTRLWLPEHLKNLPQPTAAQVAFLRAAEEHPPPQHPWKMWHGRKRTYWLCKRCRVKVGEPAVRLGPVEWLTWHLWRKRR